MSYNLYQLRSKNRFNVGHYFYIDGPHDTHGIVRAVKDTNDQGTLYLVRGTGRLPEGLGAPRGVS